MAQVHDLLDERGKREARELMLGRRWPRVVEAAAAWSADEEAATGYVYSGWCQTGLPHRSPKDNSAIWKLETETLTLLVEPGARVRKDGVTEHVGVPFGPKARLILIYLQSEALRTGSRDVQLGKSLRDFLRRLELSVGGETMRMVRMQAERLSRCKLSFHATHGNRVGMSQTTIVDDAIYMTESGASQASLFVEVARLSEKFFTALRQHAVPLDEAAIKRISNSSMALDVYCWLAYRLHALGEERVISWKALAAQFGAGVKQQKHFKRAFSENLELATAVYRDAKVTLLKDGSGVLLKPSLPPVARRA
jgi:hypothetical protein